MTKLSSVMGCVMAVLRIAVDGWMGGCNARFKDCYLVKMYHQIVYKRKKLRLCYSFAEKKFKREKKLFIQWRNLAVRAVNESKDSMDEVAMDLAT